MSTDNPRRTPQNREHLRSRHRSEVYELVHAVHRELVGGSIPPEGPERDALFAEMHRREDESGVALREGTDALIALLEEWDERYGR